VYSSSTFPRQSRSKLSRSAAVIGSRVRQDSSGVGAHAPLLPGQRSARKARAREVRLPWVHLSASACEESVGQVLRQLPSRHRQQGRQGGPSDHPRVADGVDQEQPTPGRPRSARQPRCHNLISGTPHRWPGTGNRGRIKIAARVRPGLPTQGSLFRRNPRISGLAGLRGPRDGREKPLGHAQGGR